MPDSLETTLSALGHAQIVIAIEKEALATDQEIYNLKEELEPYLLKPEGGDLEELQSAEGERRAASRGASIGTAEQERPALRVYPTLGLGFGVADRSGTRQVEDDQRVSAVVGPPELSLIRPMATRAGRLTIRPSWGIRRLRIDEIWAAGFDGDGVIIGHLDTGVDGSHPALQGAISDFAEFDLMGDRVDGALPWDSQGHGTHTAGTMVGRSEQGTFGVAPGAKIASGMVVEGGQVITRMLSGMEWIAAQDVKILNMSVGVRGFSPDFEIIIQALRNAGVLPLVAVGNDFANSSRSPGNYPAVLSVGACNQSDFVAGISGSQTFDRLDDPIVPDLVAPGVQILSSVPEGRYRKMDGTSMATPHIAGLAALLLQAKPGASINELENAILQSCTRPTTMRETRANRGVPDAVKAFALLTGHAPTDLVA